jgi:hypothetical protein
MKRAMFTILWAAIFFVAAIIADKIALQIFRATGIISWPPSATVDVLLFLIAAGSSLVALSLGSRGILNGRWSLWMVYRAPGNHLDFERVGKWLLEALYVWCVVMHILLRPAFTLPNCG